MGTRSFVGVMIGDVCRAVYVHFDGYLDGVGARLQSYKDQAAVEQLISHGDRSTLEANFYKDRGETDVDPTDYGTFDEFFEACENSWGEWYYIFQNGGWVCGNTYDGSKLYKALVPYGDARVIYVNETQPET